MADKSRVLVIYTGGTIGMVHEPESGLYKPFDFKHLLNHVPELKYMDVNLDTIAYKKPIDSSDMTPEKWIELAATIYDNYNKYDGFVILHGSDTMSYTASALSFMLEGLNKPVIITGSQLPIGVVRTDGKENLITSIEIAADKRNGIPIVSEVAIYFEYQLLRGNRTYKRNAEYFNAFRSDNYPRLAEAGIRIDYNYAALKKANKQELKLNKELDSNIAILKLFPGITQNVVSAILNAKQLKAVVLETFGSGNATTAQWFKKELQQAIDKGIVILNVTQCAGGSVEQGRYETSSMFNDIGVISGYDITTEAAVTKLMFLLGQNRNTSEINQLLGESLAGEITIPK